jgi:hypothetical protein
VVELVNPAFVQAAPAVGDAAEAVIGTNSDVMRIGTKIIEIFFMCDFNPTPANLPAGAQRNCNQSGNQGKALKELEQKRAITYL